MPATPERQREGEPSNVIDQESTFALRAPADKRRDEMIAMVVPPPSAQ
jgi:hypothetical protein